MADVYSEKNWPLYQEEDAHLFVKLGLTSLQAKVYLTLINIGKATAKAISAAAQIDRADVYRVIAALQKQGLVEKIMGTPLEFRTTPIQDGTNILLERRAKESIELYRKAAELSQKYKETKSQQTHLDSDEQIIVIPAREAAERKLTEVGTTARKIIYGTNDWDGLMEGANFVARDFKEHKTKTVEFKALVIGPKGKQ